MAQNGATTPWGSLFGLLLLAAAAPCLGAALHVAPAGSDAAQGTEREPVASVRRALEMVAGAAEPSEVVVHAGTYPGDVSVGRPEDRQAGPRPPLLITAARKPDGTFEEVILDGGTKVARAEPVAGKPGVFKVPGTYSTNQRAHMWEIDTRTRYELVADLAAVALYPASFWHTKSEVFFHTSDGRPPEAHEVGISGGTNGITVWRPNTVVRGLQCRNFLKWRWSCGVELRAPDTAAEDCRVSNAFRGFQIMMEPPRTRIVRCRVDDCGCGVYSQGKRAVIEDCRFYKVRDAFMVPVYPQDDTAIEFYYPASEGEVRRNLGVGFCNGIFVKCPTSPFVVEHNTLVDGITFGIGCTSWHGQSVFRYNIVFGFGHPILGHNALEPTTVVDGNCLWGGLPEVGLRPFLEEPRKAGTGKHSIAADPLFAAPSAGDYRVLRGSPAAKLGPEGVTCGALGAAGQDLRDVQPPEVRVALSPPGRQVPDSALFLRRDPALGGAPCRVAALPEVENGGEWLAPERRVTLEIEARDAMGKPAQARTSIGGGAWSAPVPFQARLAIALPAADRVTTVGVQVSDAAGNWSRPVSLLLRPVEGGPKLLVPPSLYANDHGAILTLQTDRTCRVTLEYGEDRRYGAAVEQPEGAQRTWLDSTRDWLNARQRTRVESHVALLPPAVKPGVTYHYRLILEDALGNKTVTEDAALTLNGPARTWFVSPAGEDVDGGGSREKPARTIQFAVDRTLPGDRVAILPGLYAGETLVAHGGIEGAPITIEAETPGTVTLDGRHDLPACLRLVKAPHVAIRGLELRWFGKADTFYNHEKSGVYVIESPNVSVLGCRIWNDFWNGWPIGSGIYAEKSPGLRADRNVIYQMEQGIYLYYSPRAQVTHNTILMNMYGAAKFIYSAEESTCLNNSFAFSGNDQYLVHYQDEKELQSFRSDYNNLGTRLRSPDPGDEIVPDSPFFQHHGSKAVISLNGKRYNSLGTWQKEMGKDLHSSFKDPRYVDPENRDYRLKPGSPNLGAGEGGATVGALGVAD